MKVMKGLLVCCYLGFVTSRLVVPWVEVTGCDMIPSMIIRKIHQKREKGEEGNEPILQ